MLFEILHLTAERRLGEKTQVSFRYRLTGTDSLQVQLLNSETGKSLTAEAKGLKFGQWSQTTLEVDTQQLPSIDEIHLLLPKKAELLIDDLLLFEPHAK